ncbi:MAG: hypothetical protein AB2693_31725 [Candidatus Thiodiazotropha sp.]
MKMVKKFSKARFLGIHIDVKNLNNSLHFDGMLDIDDDDISLAELARRCRKKRQCDNWEENVPLAKLARYLKLKQII